VFIQREIGQLRTWNETFWFDLWVFGDYSNHHSRYDVSERGIFSPLWNKSNRLPDDNGGKSIREKKGMRAM